MQWLIGALLKPLLDWVVEKIGGLIKQWQKDKANHEENKSQAEQDTKKAAELKPDSSAEKVSEAIDDTLSDL